MYKTSGVILALLALACTVTRAFAEAAPAGVYEPVPGGWHIHIEGSDSTSKESPASRIGVSIDNPRLHRRPLYPPADKTLVWTEEERAKMESCGFRPLVLAYNEPRFLFDFHGAGGLLGHLRLGVRAPQQPGKWLHQFQSIDVSYVDGRMVYDLSDPAFSSARAHLEAIALSGSEGLLLQVRLDDFPKDSALVWAYGGASAYFTNYAMTAPEFTFAPKQCAKDQYAWSDRVFTLTRGFDKSDSIMEQVFAAPRFLPDWKAVIRGGSSLKARHGLAKPEAFLESPGVLADAMEFSEAGTACVAVEIAALPEGRADGYIAAGMGGDIAEVIGKPARAWKRALERNREIAQRIEVHTPDAHLNAAVPMMAFATDGTWGDTAILHGGWSWRFAYLGWRGWYGSDCYGWQDRVKRSIENHVRMGLIRQGADAGALSSLLDTPGGVFYNMNEVFLDHVRHYYEYTNDAELMRKVFPVLKGIVDWENRRLQPGNEGLYENALNTWISDSHWYIQGQCTQASAYMLQAHRLLARLAPLAGEDPAPYQAQADRILAAMNRTLWMPDQGVYAEYLDTRGYRMLHRQPELPTIYHAAEFGAATPQQITQMLDWANANLRSETTPGGGRLWWSSNWYPNNGRSYTHSTHEMAYAEELNFALTNYLDGRAEEPYAIVRATLCGIYNGPTPGGLACHSYTDGRQRANDEFTDAISMWGRTLAEGLFGIQPNRPEHTVRLTPQFPGAWNEASIRTPQFEYRWTRKNNTIILDWHSPEPTRLALRQYLGAASIVSVMVDGQPVPFRFEDSRSVQVGTALAARGHIEINYAPGSAANTAPAAAVRKPAPNVWQVPQVPAHQLDLWQLVDCAGIYNSTLTEALAKVEKEATPPPMESSRVGFDYWRSHLGDRHHGDPVQMPSDAAWRAKVGNDGVAWTVDGIPFKTVKEGANFAVITQTGAFPTRLDLPVNAQGKTLYLMLSGESFPVQSHMPHLRVTLAYADGTNTTRDLTSPDGIGDCWSTWCNRWHDTAANGFENLGGRFGPAGSKEAGDLTQPIRVDTEAHLVAFPLETGKTLKSVSVEAIANDVIFGVMGATVLK